MGKGHFMKYSKKLKNRCTFKYISIKARLGGNFTKFPLESSFWERGHLGQSLAFQYSTNSGTYTGVYFVQPITISQ